MGRFPPVLVVPVALGTGNLWRPYASDGADLPVAQWPCGVEQPRQRIGEFARTRRSVTRQVTLDVLDCTRKDIQLVVQRIELRTRHDEFVLAEFEFGRPVPGHPVPLPTATRAEDAWSSGPVAFGERPAAPSAVFGRRSSALADPG